MDKDEKIIQITTSSYASETEQNESFYALTDKGNIYENYYEKVVKKLEKTTYKLVWRKLKLPCKENIKF